MPSLSRSFRLFKEGLNRKLFWTYWLEFKEKGWEVFWGPTLIGVAFGIYTLWHSPAWPWFLLYVLAVVFLRINCLTHHADEGSYQFRNVLTNHSA
jgi:hypothetical protein